MILLTLVGSRTSLAAAGNGKKENQMSHEDKIEKMIELIKNDPEAALHKLGNPPNYHAGEAYAYAVFRSELASAEMIEAALKGFVKSRKNWHGEHGYWVHSLSHFSGHLWNRRMVGWIRKLNEIAFGGANELGDSSCSDRLVHDFPKYARFDDDPADFGLSEELLAWAPKGQYPLEIPERIKLAPFASEADLISWQLLNSSFRNRGQQGLDLQAMNGLVSRANDFAYGIVDRELIMKRIQSEIEKFQKELAELDDDVPDWKEPSLKEKIEVLAIQLEEQKSQHRF